MSDKNPLPQLSQRLVKLSDLQMGQVERLVSQLEWLNSHTIPALPQVNFDWPHAPVHRIGEGGVFMVTGGTLCKRHFFHEHWSLDLLQGKLLQLSNDYSWQLEAWACFSNHYHFIARDEHAKQPLETLIHQLHSQTAYELNRRETSPGRDVWYNYFDTQLTFQNSYLARLNYVHQNPVRHRLVAVANQYKWCSAAWFEQNASPSQIKTVYSFKTDRLKVQDDFEVWNECCDITY